MSLYDETVRELTAHLAQFEQIKKLALLPREFTLEAGELTPNAQGEAPGGRAEVQGR